MAHGTIERPTTQPDTPDQPGFFQRHRIKIALGATGAILGGGALGYNAYKGGDKDPGKTDRAEPGTELVLDANGNPEASPTTSSSPDTETVDVNTPEIIDASAISSTEFGQMSDAERIAVLQIPKGLTNAEYAQAWADRNTLLLTAGLNSTEYTQALDFDSHVQATYKKYHETLDRYVGQTPNIGFDKDFAVIPLSATLVLIGGGEGGDALQKELFDAADPREYAMTTDASNIENPDDVVSDTVTFRISFGDNLDSGWLDYVNADTGSNLKPLAETGRYDGTIVLSGIHWDKGLESMVPTSVERQAKN